MSPATLVLFCVLIFIILLMTLFGVMKVLPFRSGVIVMLLAVIAGCLAFLIPQTRAALNFPLDEPDGAALHYIFELQTAAAPPTEAVSEELGARRLYDAIRESAQITLGELRRDDFCHATQRLSVGYLDLDTLFADLAGAADARLREAALQSLRSEVYESDRSYRTEAARAAYDACLAEITDFSPYRRTVEVGLKLTSVNAAWQVSDAGELLQTLSTDADRLSALLEENIERVRTLTPYVQKHFALEKDAVIAPAPDERCFGETEDPYEVMAVVERAAGLLNGQEVAFRPDADFLPGASIRYYLDETILAIVWREVRDGTVCTFLEVKLSDASQMMRKLTGDSYGSDIWTPFTELCGETNAVAAMGGDLYGFRPYGINSYRGVAYRSYVDFMESCHITYDGEMLFTYVDELPTVEEVQEYLNANNVSFSVSFGPVLIDHGEIRPVTSYLIGEIWENYARSIFGQLGELHYLELVMNSDSRYGIYGEPILKQAQDVMIERGCYNAYTMDGGQTAEIYIDGTLINLPTYNTERKMTDIIAFCTAVPENDRFPE